LDPVEKMCSTICTFCQILMGCEKGERQAVHSIRRSGTRVGRCWHRFEDYTESSYENLGRTVKRKQVMGFVEKILKLQTSSIKGSKS
jgi:hypothetical protein